MKIALLGKGKTGSKILLYKKYFIEAFNTKNKPTLEKLKKFDVVISFLPGSVFANYIPMLVKLKLPVVVGSTGFVFPKNFDLTLKRKKLKWIYASNFSLGICVIKQLIEKLAVSKKLFLNPKIRINEIHHKQKKDKPSGTALSIKNWINEETPIKSSRIGDEVGFHELIFETKSEKIVLQHKAKNRKLFADGAIFCSKYILKEKFYGLKNFSEIIESELMK